MLKIDMGRFVESGQGANGYSYDSLDNADVMVKLYNEDYDHDSVVKEYNVAKRVFELGVPSPDPGVLVTDGRRLGIMFKRIKGKRSFARAIADEPGRVGEYAAEFALNCKRFHMVEIPAGADIPNAKDDFLTLLRADTLFDDARKRRFADFITNGIPDSMTALHGDMHFGNVLTTLPKGAPSSDPHLVYFIDLGYFGYGCPLMDIGMTYNICNLAGDEFLFHDFHFHHDTALQAWEYFRNEYFFGPEQLAAKWWGTGMSQAQVDRKMEPFALMKLLLVEYNCHAMPENYIPFALRVVDEL